MNVFGIGTMEMVVILLVAFIALGPGKTMDAARTIGKVVREARRTFTDVMDAASVTDDDINRRNAPAATPPPDAPSPQPDAPSRPPSAPLPMPAHLQAQNDATPADRTEASAESPTDPDTRVS